MRCITYQGLSKDVNYVLNQVMHLILIDRGQLTLDHTIDWILIFFELEIENVSPPKLYEERSYVCLKFYQL